MLLVHGSRTRGAELLLDNTEAASFPATNGELGSNRAMNGLTTALAIGGFLGTFDEHGDAVTLGDRHDDFSRVGRIGSDQADGLLGGNIRAGGVELGDVGQNVRDVVERDRFRQGLSEDVRQNGVAFFVDDDALDFLDLVGDSLGGRLQFLDFVLGCGCSCHCVSSVIERNV